MTLLELVEKITAMSGFSRASGVEVELVEPGRVHMSLARKPELLQFNGFFHGGVISGLADHAAGAAVTTALPAGRVAVTVAIHVNFLAAAKGERIVARARAVQVGNTICVAAVEVVAHRQASESVCALATATFRVVDMPALPD